MPDPVLIDGTMPKMTGAELCRTLAADPVTAGIPVVTVSGSITPHEAKQKMPCWPMP